MDCTPVTEDDIDILGVKTGDCASQQVVECLAQLVCLRAKTSYWQRPGTWLDISADNVTALNVADSLSLLDSHRSHCPRDRTPLRKLHTPPSSENAHLRHLQQTR